MFAAIHWLRRPCGLTFACVVVTAGLVDLGAEAVRIAMPHCRRLLEIPTWMGSTEWNASHYGPEWANRSAMR